MSMQIFNCFPTFIKYFPSAFFLAFSVYGKNANNTFSASKLKFIHQIKFLLTIIRCDPTLWDLTTFKYFYQLGLESVCLSLCMSVCLSVCPLFMYQIFRPILPPLPKVECPKVVEIRNPWGKDLERSGLRIKHFCWEVV